MITIEDIRNAKWQSGFDHVGSASAGPNGGGQTELWRARVYAGPHVVGNRSGRKWQGPTRRTPEAAAQDYCDYINSGKAPAPKLKKVSKVRRRPLMLKRAKRESQPVVKRQMSDREKKARKIIREELAKNPQTKKHEPVAYLIGERGDCMAVKVGHADYDVHSRLATMQTGNPRELVLLGTMPGGEAKERELHEQFEADNILNEWFEPSKELLAEFDLTEKKFYETVGMEFLVV